MEKKKILLIIPNLDYGGAQNSFAKLSNLLAKHFQVFHVVFNTDGLADYELAGELISLDIPASTFWVSKCYYFWQRVLALKKIKRKLKVEVSISFLEGADYVNVLSQINDKIVLSVRGSKIHDENIVGFMRWFRLKLTIPILYKRADKIVVVTEGIKHELTKFFPESHIHTIYNGYDFAYLKAQAAEKAELPTEIRDRQVIISLSRLAPEKGLHHLVEIFAKVRLRQANTVLVIIGSGGQEEALKRKCDGLELRYNSGQKIPSSIDVYFAGYLANPYPLLSKAHVFVLTSSAEGFPNSLVESMALGIPVISTDCPHGPGEILRSEAGKREENECLLTDYGVLAPTFNEPMSYQVWEEQLCHLLANKKLQEKYHYNGLKRASEFTITKLENDWLDVVIKTLAKG